MFDGLFAPQGAVVIGASRDPVKLGYGVARNLVISGYPGAIHLVNPNGGSLFDRPLYPDVGSVPDPVDLAIIMIPAAGVPDALEACGRRGIRFAIVGAGGFRETGPQGARLEQRCLEVARRHAIRVLGPNCIGYLDTHLPIDTSFLPLPGPIPGEIAFLSHSGAICEAVIDWARGQGFGLSRLVSLGNQMDLNEGDLLPATAADDKTHVVAMYLEGIGDGASFIESARQVTRSKPVVAIKVGRSAAGRAAVASHTGALAGEDQAFDAAFRKAGVIRARHSEEMFDWARALAWCPLPPGPRMAVLSNAGGPGAIAADSLEENGLRLAKLEAATREQLAGFLPQAASLRNPVDMLAGAGPREYADALRLLLGDPGVDGIIVILPPPPVTTAAEVAGAIIPVVRSASKPVVVALMGEELIAHAAQLFRMARIPDYRFPERAASALRVLHMRARQLAHGEAEAPTAYGVDPDRAARIVKTAARGGERFLDAHDSLALIEAYGLPVSRQAAVDSLEAAIGKAGEFGYPVVLKINSPDVPHKSDLGGVALDLRSEADLRSAFEALEQRLGSALPRLEGAGFILQPQAGPGRDVIIGFVRDEQFGPLLMFGSGGVEVEALGDVAFELAPLSPAEASRMFEATLAGKRLRGLRGQAPADRQAVIEALCRLSQLALDFPELQELEINPLRVFEEGQGALALDVRARGGPLPDATGK